MEKGKGGEQEREEGVIGRDAITLSVIKIHSLGTMDDFLYIADRY